FRRAHPTQIEYGQTRNVTIFTRCSRPGSRARAATVRPQPGWYARTGTWPGSAGPNTRAAARHWPPSCAPPLLLQPGDLAATSRPGLRAGERPWHDSWTPTAGFMDAVTH